MSAEFEDPFTLDFRVDSFNSGSISFGRFESEDLCWERRSSFSHNRYLEEVEKCSKPGSVTQKKAYFEAHFRKKGFPLLTSNAKAAGATENEKMSNHEEIDHTLDGSVHHLATDGYTSHVEANSQTKDDLDCETTDLDTSHCPNKAGNNVDEEVSSGMRYDIQPSSLPKKNSSSKLEPIKPRLAPRVSRRSTSTAKDRVGNEAMRSKAEKKISGETSRRPIRQSTAHQVTLRGLESKGAEKINSAEKEGRTISKTKVEPQKVLSRAYHSANRVKPTVGVTNPSARRGVPSSVFKSNEHVQRREVDMPLNIEPRRQHVKPSIPGTSLPKSSQLHAKARDQQTSSTSARAKTGDRRATSCHSTVTSDSSSSSSARTSKVKTSKVGISTPTISRKGEQVKEKPTSLRSHQTREGNQLHKGKTLDGKQKTRMDQRSGYASFNGSARAGRMAIGVVS